MLPRLHLTRVLKGLSGPWSMLQECGGMGKSWKNRQHASTGYPYSHMRTSHVHIVRPKVRSEDGNSFFFGQRHSQLLYGTSHAGVHRHHAESLL